MWFDFSYDNMTGETWKATELVQMVRKLQPDIIIDNRLEVSGSGLGSLATGNPTPYHGDFVSPEQMIPPNGIQDVNGNDMIWESCVTINNHWSYAREDRFFKPTSMLIKKLVEIVSKGGNLLLDIGPDGNGKVPEESVKALEEIGKWMEKNKESIIGQDFPIQLALSFCDHLVNWSPDIPERYRQKRTPLLLTSQRPRLLFLDNLRRIKSSEYSIYLSGRYVEIKMFPLSFKEFVEFGYRDVDTGHIIENIVYFELLRRGFDVAVGKVSDKEIDFLVGE